MSIDLRQYERFDTRVGASAARPPLVPRPFADAASQAFDKSSAEAKVGLESGTAVLLELAERVAAPEPDPDALQGLTRVAETARARLPEGSRDYLDAVGPVTASVVTPLEERRRQAAMVGLAGALTQQKAVLRRLALLGAPLSTLRAVAKGQVEKLHATGLMAGDRATLERAWDEELAGNHLLGRLDKDADLPLAEQPEAGLLEPETLLHLEGLQRQRQAARRSEQLGGVLQGAVTGAAAGRAPSAEQAAALEGELPGLSQAAAREAEAWHQKQDAILGLVERNPLLGKLKDLAGGGPLYRRLLVEQQRRAGVPETDLRIWDQGESDAAVADVLALPDETAPAAARSTALLGYARQHLAGLPAELRPLALAELQRRGLAPEDAAALDAVAGDLADRRDIAALATARGWARKGRVSAPGAADLVQLADSGDGVSDASPTSTQVAEGQDEGDLRPALDGLLTDDSIAPSQSAGPASPVANPGDPWPAGPETDANWRAATPLPDGKPRDQQERDQIGDLLVDLADREADRRGHSALAELQVYFQNDPDYGAWLSRLDGIVSTGQAYEAGSYEIDAAGASALLHQQAKIIKDGGLPSIPGDQVLKDWFDLNAVVRGARTEEDLPLAADLLEHFLEGSGEAFPLPLQRLFRYERFRETVEGVQRYFTAWIRGDQRPSAKAPLEELYSKLYAPDGRGFVLADGESITISSKWQHTTAIDLARGFQLVMEHANDELKDISAALGAFGVTAVGTFTFTREGDRIKFVGDVVYEFSETYDFNPGDEFSFKIGNKPYHFTSERINATQEYFGSAPFDLAVNRWSQSITGDIVIRSTATRGFPAPWIENLAWDKPSDDDVR